MKWKWRNIPIPEAYVAGLVVGILLQVLLPQAIFAQRWIGLVLGGPLLAAGVALAVWAVLEASEISIDSPDRLLINGPYALSRNPMYVAWTLMTLASALLLNTLWLLVLLPFILTYVHFVDIRQEEASLEEQFGEAYARYRAKVRRYL
jgi:protein-S-isoprenylcysteine O-methyltransferase Ste14